MSSTAITSTVGYEVQYRLVGHLYPEGDRLRTKVLVAQSDEEARQDVQFLIDRPWVPGTTVEVLRLVRVTKQVTREVVDLGVDSGSTKEGP